jgi:hypothetical protein
MVGRKIILLLWLSAIGVILAKEAPLLKLPRNQAVINTPCPTFTWSETGAGDTYTLEIASEKTFKEPLITKTALLQPSYTLTSSEALPDGNYWWRVKAKSPNGEESDYQEPFSFFLDTLPPETPILLEPQNGEVLRTSTPLFSWTATAGEQGKYIIQYATNTGFTKNVTTKVLSQSQYEVPQEARLPNGMWFWHVKAIDEAGNESPYQIIPFSFKVDVSFPGVPTLLYPPNEAYINTPYPEFKWSSTPGAKYYTLQYAVDQGFTTGVVTVSPITSNNYVVPQETPLIDTLTYFWRVEAFNESGLGSGYQLPYSFVLDTQPPPTPKLESPAHNAILANPHPTFQWSTVAGETENTYILEYARDKKFTLGLVIVSEIEGLSYTIPLGKGLIDACYWWRVKACDKAGNESAFPKEPFSFTIDTQPPAIPKLKKPLNEAFLRDPTPRFEWEEVRDADSYTLSYAKDAEFTQDVQELTGITSNFCELTRDETLADGTYYWRVRAEDKAKNKSQYQDMPFSFTIDTIPPEVPLLKEPQDKSLTGERRPKFTWSATAGPRGEYTLQYARDSSFTQEVVTVSKLQNNFYTPPLETSLQNGEYYWRVKARDAAGNESGYNLKPFSFQVVNTLEAKVEDISPSTVFQGEVLSVLKLKLTSKKGVVWTEVKIEKIGTVPDESILAVRVYSDSNASGSFELDKDTLISPLSGRFKNNQALLELTPPQRIIYHPRVYFIVYFLSPQVIPDKTFGASLSQDAFSVAYPAVVQPYNLPFQTRLVTVNSKPGTLTVRSENLAPQEALQLTENLPFLKLILSVNTYSIPWRGLRINRVGNGKDSDISKLLVYKDTGDEKFSPATDELVALKKSPFINKETKIIFTQPEIIRENTTYYYFLVGELDVNATPGKKVGIECTTSSYFLLNGPHRVSEKNFPLTSQLVKIVPTVDTLIPEFIDLTPTEVRQGDENIPLIKLVLKTNVRTASWKGLSLKKIGTCQPEDIIRLSLYKDTGNDTFSAGEDVILSEAVYEGEYFRFSLATPQNISTLPAIYFIAFNLSLDADVGSEIGFSIEDSSAVEVSPPDRVHGVKPPFSTLKACVSQYPCQVEVSARDIALPKLRQGAISAPFGVLQIRTLKGKVPLRKITLELCGSVKSEDIVGIKIYKDTGNKTFERELDLLISSGKEKFTRKLASVKLTPVPMLTSQTTYAYITYDLSKKAPPGATVGCRVVVDRSDPENPVNFLEVAPPAVVQNFSFSSSLSTIIDRRTPTTPVIEVRATRVNNSLFISSNTYLACSWWSEAEGGIKENLYALGTTPGGNEVIPWTSVGQEMSVRCTKLSLSENVAYYFSVKSRSQAGFESEVGVSLPIIVDLSPPVFEGKLQVKRAPRREKVIIITWKEAKENDQGSGVSHYELQKRTGSIQKWTTLSARIPAFQKGITYIEEKPGVYYYRIRAIDKVGNKSAWILGDKPITLGALPKEVISELSNYPNPFDSRRETTKIIYRLNQPTDVILEIYDLGGYLVKTFSAKSGEKGGRVGYNELEWDGRDSNGEKVAKGVYLLLIKATCGGKGAKKIRKIGVIH